MKIRDVPLDSLFQDPSNARVHPEKNMDSIIGSLRQFGQVEPLVVQRGTGKIIGGNGRFEAMKKLGWDKCKVVDIEVDDLHATALGIALNRTAELAEWDTHTLGKLLETLRDDSFALDGIGFDDKDLQGYIHLEYDGPAGQELDTGEKISGMMNYSVIVDFDSEAKQAELLAELEERGMKCRLLIT